MTASLDTGTIVTFDADLIRQRYLFKDVGDQIAHKLVTRLADGAYATVTKPEQLSALETPDLQRVNATSTFDSKTTSMNYRSG